MKVIIENQIIETGFISHIEKVWDMNNGVAGTYYYSFSLEINWIVDRPKLSICNLCTNEHYDKGEFENEKQIILEHADRILKFLDKHSDKPNWPYPVFK